MRISDWSSDVCSSDLSARRGQRRGDKDEAELKVADGLGRIGVARPRYVADRLEDEEHDPDGDRQTRLGHAYIDGKKPPGKILPQVILRRFRGVAHDRFPQDRKSTRLNSSH